MKKLKSRITRGVVSLMGFDFKVKNKHADQVIQDDALNRLDLENKSDRLCFGLKLFVLQPEMVTQPDVRTLLESN